MLLLVISSIFGGWLSSCYQKREWNRQQQANEKDRTKEWAEASKKWQHARLKLSQKLDLYFADPNIRTKFVEITELTNEKGNSVFVEVNNELGTLKDKPDVLNESVKKVEEQSAEYKELKARIRRNILEMLSQAMAKTRELRDLMQQEIEKETTTVTEINRGWK